MKIKKDVKKAVNLLQADYYLAYINYPRVENNYIPPEQAHELIAHSPLKVGKGNYSPIKEKELVFNKQNALLFLSQERLVSPSMAVSYADVIDKYFNDSLDFIGDKKDEFITLLSIMKDFLTKRLGIADIDKQELAIQKLNDEIYANSKENPMAFYEVPSIKFFQMSGSNKKRHPVEVLDSVWIKKYRNKKLKEKKDLWIRLEYLTQCDAHFRNQAKEAKKQIMIEDEKIATAAKNSLNILSKKLKKI